MSQPQPLASTNILPFPHDRAEREDASRHGEATAKRRASGAIELPLEPPPLRRGNVKAYLIVPFYSDQRSTLHVGQPRVLATPLAEEDARGFKMSRSRGRVTSSRVHALAIAIILILLLPILILINKTASFSATASPRDSAATEPQATIFLPAISTPTTLKATAGQRVQFPIAIGGTDPVSGGGKIVISRLPSGTIFSAGAPQGETKWELRPVEATNLRLFLPKESHDEATLIVQLLADDGHVISDAATILEVIRVPREGIPVRRVKTEVVHGQIWEQSDQELNANNAEAPTAGPASDPVPLPPRRPPVAN
jgi:hypothetical protein